MRVPGRFWWATALAACAAAALVVAAPVFYLNSQIPLDIELGLPFRTDVLIAAVLALLLLIFSLVVAHTAARSLDGYRRRRRALCGDVDALPLAVTPAPAGDAPLQPDGTLVLQWRKSPTALLSMSIVGAFALVMVPFYVLLGYLGLSETLQRARTPGDTLPHALLVILTVAVAVTCGVLCVIAARILWFQWRHAYGATATADGLKCVTETGRRVVIPWSDARLFEVEKLSSRALGKRTWRLYGSRAVAMWDYFSLSQSDIPDGASTVEMKLRQDALVQLITARTGLAPRTLSKTLTATASSAPRRQWVAAAAHILLTAMTLALAVAVVVAPLTDTPWLNVAFCLPLVVAAILLVRMFIHVRRALSQQLVRSDVSQDSALIFSLKDDSLRGKVYALWIGPSRAAHVGRFLVGALLATELLPFIQLFLGFLGSAAPFSLHFTLTSPLTAPPPAPPFFSLTGLLVGTLGAYGFVGLILCYFTTFRAGPTLRADDVGLSATAGTFTFTYPWSEMVEVREIIEGGDIASYTVHNHAGNVLFRWPAHLANTAPLVHIPDAEPISPAALAQLVSQRIGGAEN